MIRIIKDKFVFALFVVLGLCLVSIGIDWLKVIRLNIASATTLLSR